MDKTAEQLAPAAKSPLGRWLEVSNMFLWGFGWSSSVAVMLLSERMPNSLWRGSLVVASLIFWTWEIYRKEKEPRGGASGCLWLPTVTCLVALFFLRKHVWAPPAIGFVIGGYFWAHYRSLGRSYPFLLLGCVASGLVTLSVPWPDAQRCALALVASGLIVSLQGAWSIVSYAVGGVQEGAVPSPPAADSGDRLLLRVIHLVFGEIEHSSIADVGFEQRLRSRFSSEIGELNRQGFDYLCSDGEAFPIARLLLGLPAIAVISMLLQRVPMIVRAGKIIAAFPALVTDSNKGYVNLDGTGAVFYTAFVDGTLLVSKDYDDPSHRGPMIVKHARKATIAQTWADHQQRILALVEEGRQVDPRHDYLFFVEQSRKATARW